MIDETKLRTWLVSPYEGVPYGESDVGNAERLVEGCERSCGCSTFAMTDEEFELRRREAESSWGCPPKATVDRFTANSAALGVIGEMAAVVAQWASDQLALTRNQYPIDLHRQQQLEGVRTACLQLTPERFAAVVAMLAVAQPPPDQSSPTTIPAPPLTQPSSEPIELP